jgi:hypothetical protein
MFLSSGRSGHRETRSGCAWCVPAGGRAGPVTGSLAGAVGDSLVASVGGSKPAVASDDENHVSHSRHFSVGVAS